MNRKIAALTLASLLSTGSVLALATEKNVHEHTLPPDAVPGVNKAQGPESNEEKADKKGEESSGSNSGAESHETEKDAASSSSSVEDVKN
ncbi:MULTISPECIES: hypothetical protein [unclassified Pseudomonas]|jgi:hypothetical protein|uniref:hypothetical protein n=1 Tax=unclassified Pseudomonas TaxID=196821 RepID=UPI00069E06FC|nr:MULTISPECIES: hypothetical protein [unclassified Pseudomonas]WPN44817.1 hypothetical protein QMK58_16610 [Pseudomonas sp. P8_241]